MVTACMPCYRAFETKSGSNSFGYSVTMVLFAEERPPWQDVLPIFSSCCKDETRLWPSRGMDGSEHMCMGKQGSVVFQEKRPELWDKIRLPYLYSTTTHTFGIWSTLSPLIWSLSRAALCFFNPEKKCSVNKGRSFLGLASCKRSPGPSNWSYQISIMWPYLAGGSTIIYQYELRTYQQNHWRSCPEWVQWRKGLTKALAIFFSLTLTLVCSTFVAAVPRSFFFMWVVGYSYYYDLREH